MEEDEAQSCSVVVWIPYWVQKPALESFERNTDIVDYVSMFWYHLAPDGRVRKYRHARVDQDVIDEAQQQGAKVLALVANLPDDQRRDDPGGDWDPKRVEAVIATPEQRQRHVAELLALTQEHGFDGINIDYEALPGKLRNHFTLFVQELAAALHAQDKLLAVALHPKVGEGKGIWDNGSQAQDWVQLSRHADQLHLMSYGEHDSSTRPGPIASIEWLRPILHYARNELEVPADRLFMGVPVYAEAWEQREHGRYRAASELLTFMDVHRAVLDYDAQPQWSDDYESPFLKFRSRNGRERVVWYEDGRSVERKLALGREFGVCNVGVWRLGGEDPATWERLRESMHRSD